MASRFSGTPVSFFIYSSPSPSQEEEEQQHQQQIGSPTSVLPVSFSSSREQQNQIVTPFTPLNAPKIMNPNFSISPISSADLFKFQVPYTTDDDVVLQNLIHIIHSIINADGKKSKSKSKSSSLTLTPAQRLFNSLDLVQKKVTKQLDRIKETPTFQIGMLLEHQLGWWFCTGTDLTPAYIFEEYQGERQGFGEYFSMIEMTGDDEMLLSLLLFPNSNKLGVPRLLLVLLPFPFSHLKKNKLGDLLVL